MFKFLSKELHACTAKLLLVNQFALSTRPSMTRKVSTPWPTTVASERDTVQTTVPIKFGVSTSLIGINGVRTSSTRGLWEKRTMIFRPWAKTRCHCPYAGRDGKCTFCVQRIQEAKIQVKVNAQRATRLSGKDGAEMQIDDADLKYRTEPSNQLARRCVPPMHHFRRHLGFGKSG